MKSYYWSTIPVSSIYIGEHTVCACTQTHHPSNLFVGSWSESSAMESEPTELDESYPSYSHTTQLIICLSPVLWNGMIYFWEIVIIFLVHSWVNTINHTFTLDFSSMSFFPSDPPSIIYISHGIPSPWYTCGIYMADARSQAALSLYTLPLSCPHITIFGHAQNSRLVFLP